MCLLVDLSVMATYIVKNKITVISNYISMQYLESAERLLEVGILPILAPLLLLSSKENVLLRNTEDCIDGVASTDGVVVVEVSPFRSWLELSSDNSRNTS